MAKVRGVTKNTLGYKAKATPRTGTGKGKAVVGRTKPVTKQEFNSGGNKMMKVATPRNKSNALTTSSAREEKFAIKKRK
jgi:hypothetical protein